VTGIRAPAEHDVAEEVVREKDEGREGHEGVTAVRTASRKQQLLQNSSSSSRGESSQCLWGLRHVGVLQVVREHYLRDDIW
jgi:hypothetical protein